MFGAVCYQAGRIINGSNKEDSNEDGNEDSNEEDCIQSKGLRKESSACSQEGSR